MLKALDLFCGLGGWSDGLAQEGFDVVGVEIEPKIAKLYKYRCMLANVRELSGKGFKGFDLIVGSPPCRDFSNLARIVGFRWKIKPNPQNGLKNIYAFIDFVKAAQPRFWLMENSPNLEKYLSLKPKVVKAPIGKTMKRSFWGNFPLFLIPQDMNKGVLMSRSKTGNITHMRINGKIPKHESNERARIPLPVARALGRAVIQALEK